MQSVLTRMLRQLEKMTREHISISRAIDLIEERARGSQELLVVNLLRECYQESLSEEPLTKVA